MKHIVEAIFGEEAAKDNDIVALYEGANKEAMKELIKFTAREFEKTLNDLQAEGVLSDFNESFNL